MRGHFQLLALVGLLVAPLAPAADFPENGRLLARETYVPPAFADSGFKQTDEIRAYYETEVLAEFRAAGSKATMERLDYASDGLRVRGFLLEPRKADADQTEAPPRPLIIFNRGGNGDYGKIDVRTLSWLANFAERGYAVAATQYRGNDGGEGADEFGGADVNDIFALITAVKSAARIDPARIFVMGHSRGGMMTYLALRDRHVFRAAAVLAGECDLAAGLADWPDFEGVYAERIPDYAGNKDEALRARSSCSWPERIHAPVLILQGDKDRQVEPSQARLAETRLRAAGKDVTLREFGGGHNLFFHPDFAPAVTQAVVEFFARSTAPMENSQ